MRLPAVTIVMGVRNEGAYLSRALESVAGQTFQDFECIVVDDGSTDGGAELASRYGDERIRVVRQAREGLAAALNRGMGLARGDLVARHDGDDVSEPTRLARQAAFMEAHPDVVVCGTNAIVMDEDEQTLGTTRLPVTDAAIRASVGGENPFVHGTVILRKSAVLRLGGYRTEFARAQDLDLWLRMMEMGPVANLGDCLYRCRLRQGRVGARWLREQRAYARLARTCAMARAAGLPEPPLRVDTNRVPVALRVAWAVRGARPDVEYHVHAARILAGSGRRGEARARLVRAVRRNPASAYAWLSLALGCLPHRLEIGARRFGS